MIIDFMNKWITPENVMWVAAVTSLLLLLFVGAVSSIVLNRSNRGMMRFLKIGVFFTVSLVVLFPVLVLLFGETVRGTPCGFYLLFFSLFCYYLGKKVGFSTGRSSMSDLIGLEMFDSIEDAQDRLYESRQRLLSRDEVIKSIAELSKNSLPMGTLSGKNRDAQTVNAGQRRNRESEVMDVMVEVEEKKRVK